MKKFIFTLLLIGAVGAHSAFAQAPSSKKINAGIGVSGWGIPVFATVEIPLQAENQSIVFGGSFRSKTESFSYLTSSSSWRHTIIGLEGGWNYYFDDLLDVPRDFDLYGGLRLNYYIWQTKLVDNIDGFNGEYTGSSGGLGVRGVIGGRYHFKESTSLFVELGGGNMISGGRLGLSFGI